MEEDLYLDTIDPFEETSEVNAEAGDFLHAEALEDSLEFTPGIDDLPL